MSSRRHVVAFVHREQVDWYASLFESLKSKHGLSTELWVQGETDARRGRTSGSFDVVRDLSAGFGDAPLVDESEALSRMRALERRDPGFSLAMGLATDRLFQVRGWSRARALGYACHLQDAMQEALCERGTPVVAFGENSYFAYQLARAVLGPEVPYIQAEPARTWPGRIFWFDRQPGSWPACKEAYATFARAGIPADLRAAAAARLAEIRTQAESDPRAPGVRASMAGRNDLVASRHLEHYARQARDALQAAKDRAYRTNPLDEPPSVGMPHAAIARQMRRVRRARAFRARATRQIPPRGRYAAYFLHYQPEAVVDHGAFAYRDQLSALRAISAALPADTKLVVKEHAPSVGIRDASFYDEILALPNTMLLADDVRSHPVIRDATAVFTLVGTVGLEAIFLGVPSFVFGDIFYDTFDGVTKLREPASLRQTVQRVLAEWKPPGDDEAALRTLAAMHAASFPARFGPSFTLEEMRAPENEAPLLASLSQYLEA